MNSSKIKNLKEELKDTKFKLKKWTLSKNNLGWSHDHCEICHVEISNLKDAESEAYVDEIFFIGFVNLVLKNIKIN